MRKNLLVLLTLVALLVLAACSNTGEAVNTSAPAESGGKESTTEEKEDITIAYFSAGASNNYLQTGIQEAEKVADDYGWNIEVYDGGFDPLTQLNQVQNAVAQDKYDAFLIEAVDGNQLCDIVQSQVLPKGIAVSAINIELCGAIDEAAEGTLTFVGGQGVNIYEDIYKNIVENNPEGGKIAVIGGPSTGTPYLNNIKGMEKVIASDDKWEIIGPFSTDYTANQAFQVAQNAIQANPDLKVIFSNYSGMTNGVVEAVNAAGKKGEIKIYDFGGDEWSFNAIKNGDIEQTVIMLPKEEVQRGMEAIQLHFEGKDVPTFYDLTTEDILPGTPYVNKNNIGEFETKGLPEY
ncbi:MAG TPA: sugar ABC transporter substrate-binding protein [Ureibacillus sp.]|nr:sugar ABC transporter substrate-binding protein [Ureibacillus sp.]